MNRCVFLCLCLVMLSAPGRALPRGAQESLMSIVPTSTLIFVR